VPAQQRLWGHEETLPTSPWQSSSRGGKKYPIGKSKAGPFDLSPKDIQLMSEHDDLEILGGLALALGKEQPEQHPTHQVHEREKHCPPSFDWLIEED
jgi:hypothetical protein